MGVAPNQYSRLEIEEFANEKTDKNYAQWQYYEGGRECQVDNAKIVYVWWRRRIHSLGGKERELMDGITSFREDKENAKTTQMSPM